MDGWTVVGRRSTCSRVFGGETGFADEFPELENVRSIGHIKATAEKSDRPLRAVLEASWFSVLSQSELSLDDLCDVLLVLERIYERTSASKELSAFSVQTLNHKEVKVAMGKLLETECYDITHLMIMSRYVERIEACLAGNPAQPKAQFKGMALAFFREFSKKGHSTTDEESFAQTTTYIKRFLAGFGTEEFEEKPIDGYPSGYEPPDDFRYIPTYPRTQDVDGGLPFLRPNIAKGPFRSLDDYLDVQYRLLREEYIGALRNGVRDMRKNKFSQDVVLFMGQRAARNEAADEFGTITLKIIANTGKMQEFKSGVLVAHSRDGLNSFVYSTRLDTGQGSFGPQGTVTLELCNPNDGQFFKLGTPHQLLVLKSAYYEAFRYTLDALKTITELPFQSYIVNCVKDENHPKPWRRADPRRLLQESRPCMNASQFRAFYQTLLRKVCIIQGPPGTGKTYVGLRIVESILKHEITNTPVLVVCYTNHALDQFLEGMLRFTDSIVRVGGRSKSEKLTRFQFENVKNESQRHTWLSREDWRKKNESNERIELCRKRLQEDEALLGLIQGPSAESLVGSAEGPDASPSRDQRRQIKARAFTRRSILGKNEISKLCQELSRISECSEFLEVAKLCREYEAHKDFVEDPRSPSDDVDDYISMKMCSGDITEKVIADKMRKSRILNRYAFSRITEKLRYKYFHKGEKPRQPLTLNEKWRFYATLHWKKIAENSRVDLSEDDVKDPSRHELKCQKIRIQLAESHRRASDQLAQDTSLVEQLKAVQTAAILRSKSVIGLTTTGAAKRRHLLHELNCEIIIVEEAAEILESHLVAILPKGIQQIILIGDHKQLSPCINNYTLERSFNLGVSMFERLVNNGMPYVMLNVQHRMKDDFLKLLVPHIYDDITSSPKVYELESVRGMSKDLQFLSHKSRDRGSGQDSVSKSNTFEAEMIVALLDHLDYQGYGPQDIVVLCAYTGQQQFVFDCLRRRPSGGIPRVSTIDDYQGEECDIVIVSFVRSNPQNEIGFLAKPNRVCVALSRARKGLFCFGDFEAYETRSPLWKGILNTLRGLAAINPYLELKCDSHGTLARVRAPEDFQRYMPSGCCQKACESLLECGHRCPYPCHLKDPHPVCTQACSYKYPECGHPCRRKCYRDHGTCEEIVPKVLQCGHTEYAPCPEPAIRLECHERCTKELDCGHQCGGLCSKPCTQDCVTKVLITRECGHDSVVPCHTREQQRAKDFCKSKVRVQLSCGHTEEVQCRRTLDMVSLALGCVAPVANVTLPCGHTHTLPCNEHQQLDSYSCTRLVDVELLCGHRKPLPCHRSTDAAYVSEETLECGTWVEVIAKCGHALRIPCRLTENAAQFCTTNVKVELACGHPRRTACNSSRDEAKLRQLRAACKELILVEASCTHIVEIPCHEMEDEQSLLSRCKVVVTVLSQCKHFVDVVCSSSRNPNFVQNLCRIGKTVTLRCKHTLHVECSDSRSLEDMSKDCRQEVVNVLRCGHAVEQVCGGTHGNLRVKCEQACEFSHRCGHICTGNCTACRGGQNHRPCNLDCSRNLPCGHPCTGKCGRKCSPCKVPCERQCAHGQCEKKCGEPCSSKHQLCRRKGVEHCPHQSCSARNCWECDCEPCEEKCNKIHKNCNHPCEGMCGEPCVPCFRCKPKKLQKLLGNATVSGKLLQVPGCNHLVDVEIMDQVMATWKVGNPRCIKCDRDIPNWRRYNCVYNRAFRNSRPNQLTQSDEKCTREELLKKIQECKFNLASVELTEDTNDREMRRHYACQILTDLLSRLRRSKSEDLMLCELVLQVVEELMKVHDDVLLVQEGFPEWRKKTFLLSQDIFEDLAAMVDIQPEETSSWTLSSLDDITTNALRLKFIAVLPSVAKKWQDRLWSLVFAEGRFSLPAANGLLRQADSKLKIHPFYDLNDSRYPAPK